MNDKLDMALVREFADTARTDVLVYVRNFLELSRLERAFSLKKRYPFINAVGLTCSLEEAKAISNCSEVDFVTKTSKVTALSAKNNTKFDRLDDENLSILTTCDEEGKRYALTGKDVNVCIMDTGVAPHVDLGIPINRILGSRDFVNGRDFPYDDNGHGTFVAGVAVGNGLASGGKVKGVAPESGIFSLKVIGESGETGTFTILDGMQWLVDNFRRYKIKVVCMSFGAEPYGAADPLKIGAEMLVQFGMTVVAASGNDGIDGLKSPGISPDVICVGAVDDKLDTTPFTSRGYYDGVARPDYYAKGVKVEGLKPYGVYSKMSGTSVSAPYVAGVCCLLHQKYANLKPQYVKQLLDGIALEKDGHKIVTL